jgi:hypothetical protein
MTTRSGSDSNPAMMCFEREHDDARSNTRTHSRLSKRKADDVNYNKENELKNLIMYAEERFQKRSDWKKKTNK